MSNGKMDNRRFLEKLIRCAIVITFVLHFAGNPSSAVRNDLKHVHVIFAHKLYAPLTRDTKYGFPDKLEYQHFLANSTDMPNEAKAEMFDLGVYLRRRYGDFLGDIYYTEVSTMYTSEYFLSMISGLLVNAGLWPPAESQRWKEDLDWQPIPTVYEPKENDKLFLGTLCPHFLDEEKRILETDESIKNEVSAHQSLFKYISYQYGEKIEQPADIAMLYSSLESIASDRELNKTLPGWAEGLFPDGEMLNVTLLSYELLSRTKSQKQLNGGVFLKQLVRTSTEVITTNTSWDSNFNVTRDSKISLYSGEERNVIGILQAMNLWQTQHILENGASIILELRHNESADEYGFEIYYYGGMNFNETMGLTIPGCQEFCPLSDFARILSEALPTDENVLCHMEPAPIDTNAAAADTSRHQIYLRHLLIFFSIHFLFVQTAC